MSNLKNLEKGSKTQKAKDDDSSKLLAEQSSAARWRSWWSRFGPTLYLIAGFFALAATGPHSLYVLVAMLQFAMFKEVMRVCPYNSTALSARFVKWYWFVVAFAFVHISILQDAGLKLVPPDVLQAIFLCAFIFGIVFFVLSIQAGNERRCFGLFAWSVLTAFLTVVVSSAHLWNLHTHGVVWFVVPACLVISNDTWAYIFGFMMGRTPLIKISPKKTVEGFVGGGIMTVVMGWLLTYILSTWEPALRLTCPFSLATFQLGYPECARSPLHTFQTYDALFGLQFTPFQLHIMTLAVLTSLIAPFGGLFASGIKRAIDIKDFGDAIPGHGGFTDRFDCQLMNGLLTRVYLTLVKP